MALSKLIPLQASARAGQLGTAQPITTWRTLINFIPFEDGIAHVAAHCSPRFPLFAFPNTTLAGVRALKLFRLPRGAWGVAVLSDTKPEIRLYKVDDDLHSATQQAPLNIARLADISGSFIATINTNHLDAIFRLALLPFGSWAVNSPNLTTRINELQHLRVETFDKILLAYGISYISGDAARPRRLMPVLYGEIGDASLSFADTHIPAKTNSTSFTLRNSTIIWWRYAENRQPIPIYLTSATPVFPAYAGGSYCACGHLLRKEDQTALAQLGIVGNTGREQLPAFDIVNGTAGARDILLTNSISNPRLLDILRGGCGIANPNITKFVYSPNFFGAFTAYNPLGAKDTSPFVYCSLMPLPDKWGARYFFATESDFALANITNSIVATLNSAAWANFVQKFPNLAADLALLSQSLPPQAQLAAGVYLPALYQAGGAVNPLRYALGAVSYPTAIGRSLGLGGDPITVAPIPELFIIDNEYAISVGGYSPAGYNSGGSPYGLTLGQGEQVWGLWRFTPPGALQTTLQNGATQTEKPVATMKLWNVSGIGTSLSSWFIGGRASIGAFHNPQDLQGRIEFARIRFSSPDAYNEWAPDLQEVSTRWLSGFLHARNVRTYRAIFRYLDSVYIFTDFGYIRMRKRGGAVAYTLTEVDLGDVFGSWDYRSAFVNTPYGVFVITPSGMFLFDGNALRPMRDADDVIFSASWFSSVYRHIPQATPRQPKTIPSFGTEDFGTTFPDLTKEALSPYGMYVPEWDSVVWFVHSKLGQCTFVLGYNIKTKQPFILRSHKGVYWLAVDGDEKGFVELREGDFLSQGAGYQPFLFHPALGWQQQLLFGGRVAWSHPALGTFPAPLITHGVFGVFFAFTRRQHTSADPNGLFPTASAAYASSGFFYDQETERVVSLTRSAFEGRAVSFYGEHFVIAESFFTLPEQSGGKAPQVQVVARAALDTPLRISGRYINLTLCVEPSAIYQIYSQSPTFPTASPMIGTVSMFGMRGYIQGLRVEARARGFRRWK